MLSFQLPVSSGCSGQKDTLPRTRTGKRGPGRAHPPIQGRRPLPQVISPRSFSASSAQLSLDNLLEALACRVPSLYGFCNKVLIHVNLCGDYCVQQYFLVYLFFLCDVSLFFFFIYKCLLFLKDKPVCRRLLCNLFLSLIIGIL